MSAPGGVSRGRFREGRMKNEARIKKVGCYWSVCRYRHVSHAYSTYDYERLCRINANRAFCVVNVILCACGTGSMWKAWQQCSRLLKQGRARVLKYVHSICGMPLSMRDETLKDTGHTVTPKSELRVRLPLRGAVLVGMCLTLCVVGGAAWVGSDVKTRRRSTSTSCS